MAIARALVCDPAVVFADEPTGALDSNTGEEVIDVLTSLTGQCVALVMVTHDRQYAARLDRVLELKGGLIVGTERPVLANGAP